ncbi:MAG: SynChlorMet cassette protein ScmD [Candidatus Omnitrophota bacterium]
METKKQNPLANPSIVLREEFDDWALLFDPDTNDIFAIDPVAVFIWKLLNGKRSCKAILEELKECCDDIPEDAGTYVNDFIRQLEERGLVGYESTQN